MRYFAILLILAGLGTMAQAVDIWSTDGNVTTYTNGVSDPFAAGFDFTQADSGPSAQVITDVSPFWVTTLPGDTHNAQWIGALASDGDSGESTAFSDAFSLNSTSDYKLTITLSADDQLGNDGNGNEGLYIDGQAITGSSTGALWAGGLYTNTLDLGTLSSGTHHIEFNLYNSGGGPSGLIYSGTVNAAPEPISLTLLGLGALALLSRKRSV